MVYWINTMMVLATVGTAVPLKRVTVPVMVAVHPALKGF
jgi:hypothetical protein